MKTKTTKTKGICEIDGLNVTGVSEFMLKKIIAREIKKEKARSHS